MKFFRFFCRYLRVNFRWCVPVSLIFYWLYCSVLSEDGKSNKTRLLLFSECDVRGRRLIYDSANGYLKEDPQDLELFKDMVFGSATLRYVGDNYRIHEFHDVNWKGYEVMLSKVFLAPPPSSPKKIEKSRYFNHLLVNHQNSLVYRNIVIIRHENE